jgi:hypothetical protein
LVREDKLTEGSIPGTPVPLPVSPGQVICASCGKKFYKEKITKDGKVVLTHCPKCGAVIREGSGTKESISEVSHPNLVFENAKDSLLEEEKTIIPQSDTLGSAVQGGDENLPTGQILEENQVASQKTINPIENRQSEQVQPQVQTIPVDTIYLRGAVNDTFPGQDQLGFENYVYVFSDLIESKFTQVPITVGILGDWGAGKSFLLRAIQNEINRRGCPTKENFSWKRFFSRGKLSEAKIQANNSNQQSDSEKKNFSLKRLFSRKTNNEAKKPKEKGIRINCVEFNAWEYSSTDAIWPALVRKVINEMEDKIPMGYWKRIIYRIRFNFQKIIKQRKISPFWFVILIITIATIALWFYGFNSMLIFKSWFLLVLGGFLKLSFDLIQPMGLWILSLFQDRKYGKQIGYMEQIREDIQELSKVIGSNTRILIMIDDLDRCDSEKAVEVLEAIKLLLTFENAPFFIFIGIDERIVAAAVERHYHDVLSIAGVSGNDYLDKIIQIPFKIPNPTIDEVKHFLLEQTRNQKPAYVAQQIATNNGENGTQTKRETNSVFFCENEQEIIQSLAEYMRPNPRYMKRFLNIYRLVRSLAEMENETRLLDHQELLLEWLVLSFQWPNATALMMEIHECCEVRPNYKPAVASLYEMLRKNPGNNGQVNNELNSPVLRNFIMDKCKTWDWTDIEILRKYTVGFNPIIETILPLNMDTLQIKAASFE